MICELALAQLLGSSVAYKSLNHFAILASPTGLRIAHDSADTLRFSQPLQKWKLVSATPDTQTIFVAGNSSSPTKIRANRYDFGMEMFVNKGLKLNLSCTRSPYLTWREGSVGNDVPTPATPWALLSFRDEQPPWMIGFESAPASVQVSGAPGNWTLAVDSGYKGWIRFVPPLGTKPFATNSAADLGRLSRLSAPFVRMASLPSVQSPIVSTSGDQVGVTGVWKFNRPNVYVPSAIFLAPIGGYRLAMSGTPLPTNALTNDGPVFLTSGHELKVRFPVRRVPVGRAVALGELEEEPPASVSWLDGKGTVESAIRQLFANRDEALVLSAQEQNWAFISETATLEDPLSKQKLTFDASGEGFLLTGAHGLLAQCLQIAASDDPLPNAFLFSLMMPFDPSTWRFTIAKQPDGASCQMITSICAALSPDSADRLNGAMLQAGLSAQAGLRIWKQRRGIPVSEKPQVEVYPQLRASLFSLGGAQPNPLMKWMLSDLRVIGKSGFTATGTSTEFALSTESVDGKPFAFALISSVPLEVSAGENVKTLQVSPSIGMASYVATPTHSGTVSLLVKRPAYAPPLPKVCPIVLD